MHFLNFNIFTFRIQNFPKKKKKKNDTHYFSENLKYFFVVIVISCFYEFLFQVSLGVSLRLLQ